MLRLITIFIFLLVSLFSAEKVVLTPERLSENLPSASGEESAVKKNIIDWENLSKQQGVNEALVGNSQDTVRKMFGESALTPDIQQINNTYLKASETYKDNEAVNAYTNEMQSKILENSTSGSTTASGTNKEIKCYITRDIPFRYQCSLTGLMYGGGVNETGVVAKNLCRSECYQSKTCIDVTGNTPLADSSQIPNINTIINSNGVYTSATIDKDRRVQKIIFTTSSDDEKNPYFIDIVYTTKNDTNQTLVKSLRIDSSEEKRTFVFNDIAKKIYLKAFTADGVSLNANINEIYAIYGSKEKWLCPYLQDISDEKPENFAHLCPSGKIHTFTKGVSTYKICEDFGVLGDNPDGTFSSQEMCISNCKESGECKPDTSVFTTEILKNFREGCIQGQANCKDEDCTLARKRGDKIMHEVFFDAGQNPIISIQNSVQVKGVKRPRISVQDDMDFQKKSAEEWKDEAYTTMLKEKTFNTTSTHIGQNTIPLFAYGIGTLSGADYGHSGTSVRTLNIKAKPAAFDVSNNMEYKLYAIIAVDIGKQVWSESGKRVIQRDRIWYMKTGEGDQFKPFYLEEDIGYSGIKLNDMNSTDGAFFAENEYAKREFKTFSNSSWHGILSSEVAENFSSISFEPMGEPYWKFTAISNLGNFLYALPGLMRSRTKDLLENPIYTGEFDGSGDGMLAFSLSFTYSSVPLTYQEIVNKVLDGSIPTIYHSNSPHLYPNEIGSDANNYENSNIQIFRYGQSSKHTSYMRVLPRKNDIGKKGFIYVFIY